MRNPYPELTCFEAPPLISPTCQVDRTAHLLSDCPGLPGPKQSFLNDIDHTEYPISMFNVYSSKFNSQHFTLTQSPHFAPRNISLSWFSLYSTHHLISTLETVRECVLLQMVRMHSRNPLSAVMYSERMLHLLGSYVLVRNLPVSCASTPCPSRDG